MKKLLPTPPDPLLAGIEHYVVGGAVRDALLGLPAGDKDWVVVGVSPEQLAQRGFIPVGGDFPVFLHPQTKEEYALARTERKSAKGYQGFTFYTGTDVSLADDLSRRDLTVNAMAVGVDGQLHDPFNGYADLQSRTLRHIGTAFVEDPVRLLRLARFAARFSKFHIAPETKQLAQQLVNNGEVDALVPERVWQELLKGLATAHPMRMLKVLADCQALPRVIPHLQVTAQVNAAMRQAVQQGLGLEQRFAVLCHQSHDPVAIARHLKAPTAYTDMARLVSLFLAHHHQATTAETIAELLQQCDVLRRYERFMHALDAAACCDERINTKIWQAAAKAFSAVDAGQVARSCAAQGQAQQIPSAVWQARLEAVRARNHS